MSMCVAVRVYTVKEASEFKSLNQYGKKKESDTLENPFAHIAQAFFLTISYSTLYTLYVMQSINEIKMDGRV